MLTRLKVSGFKNLVDVDVRFGPFTCIAGANGVGKSNLFDAIRFLSALSSMKLIDAALSIRDEGGKTGDILRLFHAVGDTYDTEMSFEAEMIVPQSGVDDLGQKAFAGVTFLRYSLVLQYHTGAFSYEFSDEFDKTRLEIIKEELVPIKDIEEHLLFPYETAWFRDTIQTDNTDTPLISTNVDADGSRVINLVREHNSKPLSRLAANLPQTVLSAVNTAENPIPLLARREMQSWRLLQLEPAALRKPDSFNAPRNLGDDGSYLPATLYRLAHTSRDPEQVYGQIANRLAELIEDVREVWVDRDDKRELYTLKLKLHDGTSHEARALSDGTLRFLALVVLELDSQAQGLLCMEEPENGIHPKRIPAMLELLQNIAVDTEYAIDLDNPLRQVIVNTHSPVVVQQAPFDSLLVAELKEMVRASQRFQSAYFSCLSDEDDKHPNWRLKAPEKSDTVAKGVLLAYLNPVIFHNSEEEKGSLSKIRVVDRSDIQMLLPLLFGDSE